jgi:hypothetical protein
MRTPRVKLATAALALLAPAMASAEMSCAELGNYLASQPYVSAVNATTPLTTLTSAGTSPRCEANFVYSARGGVASGYAEGQLQRIALRVGLPRNPSDGGAGSLIGAWNGKVQNLGGGGLAGNVGAVTAATNAGYVGSSTDTGHTSAENPNFAVIQATNTLNYGKLDDFLIESLRQQYQWALNLARTYYGTPASRNYWNGCSTGGRQGLSLALKHGEDFDGFLVGAPANYNSRLQVATLWPWWVNKDVAGNTVTTAKFAAANASAVAACDAADGVIDGLLADPRKCSFDARANICGAPGAPGANCLNEAEAQAINMMWDGSRNDKGTRIWHPFERGAGASVASTATCGNLGSQCWAHRDTTFDWHPLPLSQFDDETELATNVVAPYSDIMSTDLQRVRGRGGKILMYHGGADPLIPHRQSIHYYNDAMQTFGGIDALTPWFRFYVAPGMGHCAGGVGPQPQNLFGTLVDWVENGKAPDSILSTNSSSGVVTRSRPLCPWPQTAIYTGTGDPNSAGSFVCGGNVETKETECLAMVAKFQKETLNAYDTSARRNPATCVAASSVPLDKRLDGYAVTARPIPADDPPAAAADE